jgi:hypothetical protein
MGYRLEGSILEVCDCNILCPCWVGEDPDHGVCQSILAYNYEQGHINGIDVSGLTFALAGIIPGNILNGNFRVVYYIDDRATPEQEQAIRDLYAGKFGGPVGEYIKLFGEVIAIERTPITFKVVEGKGYLRIGDGAEAELAPYTSATGITTTLNDSIFSTIDGAPAYVGKASKYRLAIPELDINLNLEGYNAIQGRFLFEN